MKLRCRRAASAALLIPIFMLSGCMFTTRKLPIPKPPEYEQTVAPERLVLKLNQRWAAIESLTANVEIQASVLKTSKGEAKDYTSISGIILMRKPEMLRVYGRVPVIGTRAFDMVSDGKDFTLWVPSRNLAFKGANTLKKKSKNQLENLRPGFFLDALVVRGLEPDDDYMVTADDITVEDSTRKHLYLVPEYKLSIMQPKPDGHQLTPKREVFFHRDDLLPSEQDIYDSEGTLETQVLYSNYKDYDGGKYPTLVKIIRPLEEIQVLLTVDKVVQNQSLHDDQFQLQLTEGTKIQSLE